MKIGANDIADLKIGTTEINEVRLGSVLVWERNSYLLDLYPATAAYSLRKLRSAYTGAAIRVRRSLDNTEQDIGFLGDELDTVSLLSFVGVGGGFVTTWYDQQGSNNFTQSILGNQPRIVNLGVLEIENTKPCIRFIDGNKELRLSSLSAGNSWIFGVTKMNNLSGSLWLSEYPNLDFLLYGRSDQPATTASSIDNSNYVNGVLKNLVFRAETFNELNGFQKLITVSANMNAFLNLELGRSESVIPGNNANQELILYNSNQSANRTAIETNINNYYNVY